MVDVIAVFGLTGAANVLAWIALILLGLFGLVILALSPAIIALSAASGSRIGKAFLVVVMLLIALWGGGGKWLFRLGAVVLFAFGVKAFLAADTGTALWQMGIPALYAVIALSARKKFKEQAERRAAQVQAARSEADRREAELQAGIERQVAEARAKGNKMPADGPGAASGELQKEIFDT